MARNRRRVLKWCGDTVPCIDDGYCGAEPGELLRRKVLGNGSIVGVGDVMLGEARKELGPGECGFFLFRKDAGFTPDRDEVKLGGGDTHVARFVEMELCAEGTAVDLRGTQFDELLQLRIEAGGSYSTAQFDDRVVGGACVFLELRAGESSCGHRKPPQGIEVRDGSCVHVRDACSFDIGRVER